MTEHDAASDNPQKTPPNTHPTDDEGSVCLEPVEVISESELQEIIADPAKPLSVMTREINFFAAERVSKSPLPRASTLKALKEVDPSFPDKCISLIEKEQDHRHDVENKELQALRELEDQDLTLDYAETKRGQCMTFVLCFILITGGLAMVWFGKGDIVQQIIGAVFGGGGLLGIAQALIRGKSDSSKSSNDKNDE